MNNNQTLETHSGPRARQPCKALVNIFFQLHDGCIPNISPSVGPAEERRSTATLQEDQIGVLSIPRISEVIESPELLWSQELEIKYSWSLYPLVVFAPYMGWMRNHHKLLLSHSVCLNALPHSKMRNSLSQSAFSSGHATVSRKPLPLMSPEPDAHIPKDYWFPS